MTAGDPRVDHLLAYVRLPEYFPIRWSAEGDALVWQNGQTVALREEVERILTALARAERLVPPFTVLALLLGLVRVTRAEASSFAPLRYAGDGVAERSIRRLREVDVAPDLDARGLAVVAAHVFERAGVSSDPPTAARLLQSLAVGLPPDLVRDTALLTANFVQDLGAMRVLDGAIGSMDRDALRRRLATGLEEEVQPARQEELEDLLVGAEGVRRTVEDLAGDPRHALLARLTREVLAALSLPRPIGGEEDLPLGGYSDIAPRGPLDRLLTSELAHDDGTLAVRVALGEALYLRREAPPRRPIGVRSVLVDSGVRLWGRSRIFANAVALALGASARAGARVRLYRAEGDEVREIDARTRAGFEEHLGRPTADLHPAAALPAFLEATDGGEVLVVTSAAGAEDPAFRARHAELARTGATVVTVDDEGALAVSTWAAGRRREGARARLDLGDVLARPSQSRDAGVLPAYATLHRPTLRLPESTARGRIGELPEGALVLTRDQRLVLWPSREMDFHVLARTLYAEEVAILPRGEPRAFEVDGDEAVALITQGRLRVHTARWSRARGLDVRTVDLPEEARQVFLRRGRAVAVLGAQALLADEVGALSVRVSTHDWNGRFCRDGSRLEVVEGRLVLEWAKPGAPLWFKGLFDRPGHPGPWSIQGSTAVSLADGTRIRLRRPGVHAEVQLGKKVQNVSPDGRFAWMTDERIDLVKGVVHQTSEDPRYARRPGVGWFPEGQLRRSFDQVGAVTSSRGPCLVLLHSKRGRRALLDTSSSDRHIRLVTAAGCPSLPAERWLSTEPVASDHPAARFLATAAWDDGSRAWLDRRGLLHLAPADAGRGELTLVLRQDGSVWGWCSQGWAVGRPAELMETTSAPLEQLVGWLREFAARVARAWPARSEVAR